MKHIPFLHQERKRSSDQSEQVKDFSVFDFNYIPKTAAEGNVATAVLVGDEKIIRAYPD